LGAGRLTRAVELGTGRMARDSRRRMVVSAASLIGSRGVNATSLSDVLAESRAPRGSIYHYFPAGKDELVGDAMRWTTEQVLAYQRGCTAESPSGVIEHFVELFRQSMISSHCRDGCPLAGVLIDTRSDGELVHVGRTSFRSWISLLTSQLESVGTPPRAARSLAITTLASVEGALILARAEGSVAPLEVVAEQLRHLSARTTSGPRRTPRAGSSLRPRGAP
jgi:TetR/AcrR family transcriptional repressor of lmrAB and yxaGH operons